MTQYFIEVRAVSALHDVHAHQLARDISYLSTKHLPSLAEIVADTTPLDLHTAQLYSLSGNNLSDTLSQLTQQLLVDTVIQQARIFDADEAAYALSEEQGHVVDVFFLPGVTDTLAESVLTGAQILGVSGLEQVETGRRYILDERLSDSDLQAITQALLYNPVIQHYQVYRREPSLSPPLTLTSPVTRTTGSAQSASTVMYETTLLVRTIPIVGMNDAQLQEVSRSGLLALNLDEMRTIQQHYRELGREPTDVELETLAQTWSEHCSHKTFKATVHYRELDAQDQVQAEETIQGLLKQYIMRATEEIRPEWLVSAFSDNAGIIRFTEGQDVAFKVETHNHPSAIEPFGGANTGVGGVIRDVVGVSAQPIACTDILCFGPLETPADELPAGVLSPRRIASGVVNGVRDYGNKMGIPTVNGAILYHPGYIYNPLVFCGCLGILPHGSHPNNVQEGDKIVVLGGRTGRDGIHGATFSSGEMSIELNAQAGSAVQIGAPVTEKKVTDVILQARDRQLYSAITDCGAGGFSSAIGEMGEKSGVRVELTAAPLKYQGLKPWEIWLSEAQERMVLAVPPQSLDELLAICAIEEVEASILGTFTADKRLTVLYQDQVVANLSMEFLHDGRPNRTLEAHWHLPTEQVGSVARPAPSAAPSAPGVDAAPSAPGVYPDLSVPSSAPSHLSILSSLEPTLLALLRHPSIASKEEVVRRYDHEVLGATVVKPLVGRSGNGPSDAAVLQPILAEPGRAGVVLSNGVNPLYGLIDPYHMAVNAVDEALRNLTAVGGDITRAAVLDNFCWGNPTDPEQLGGLVRAVKGCYDASLGFKTPFISGKDSLNNEYRADGRRLPVIPTLVISAVGVITDAAQTIDMTLKTPGNLLYLVGRTRNELAGSHYAEVVEPGSFKQFFPQTNVPHVDIPLAYKTMRVLGDAIRQGLVCSCHDLSEGGLALAAAEMSLASLQGVVLDIAEIPVYGSVGERVLQTEVLDIIRLFSESPSRFIVEITPEQLGAFEKYMRTNEVEDIAYLGTVTHTSRFTVRAGSEELINVSVDELQEAWKGSLA